MAINHEINNTNQSNLGVVEEFSKILEETMMPYIDGTTSLTSRVGTPPWFGGQIYSVWSSYSDQ